MCGDYYSDWGSEMSKETGGQAFPASGHPGMQHVQQEGMTLRDYFAAKVLIGTQSNPELNHWSTEQHAEYAYGAADAMLKARNQ